MIGAEGATIHAVKRTVEREGVPTPTGKRDWGKYYIRSVILDDVYKPLTFEEVAQLVSPEVAGRLDPKKHYGIWWFNRERATHIHTTENGTDGKRYRKRRKLTPKPETEWIAVPVPDSGIPRELVEVAREAIAKNRRTSRNGGRIWELSGGVLRCDECGWTMRTVTVTCGRNRLRTGLDEMIERECKGTRGDPAREAKAWVEKLAEVDRERRGYLITHRSGTYDR